MRLRRRSFACNLANRKLQGLFNRRHLLTFDFVKVFIICSPNSSLLHRLLCATGTIIPGHRVPQSVFHLYNLYNVNFIVSKNCFASDRLIAQLNRKLLPSNYEIDGGASAVITWIENSVCKNRGRDSARPSISYEMLSVAVAKITTLCGSAITLSAMTVCVYHIYKNARVVDFSLLQLNF